jgi:hypothetical protein
MTQRKARQISLCQGSLCLCKTKYGIYLGKQSIYSENKSLSGKLFLALNANKNTLQLLVSWSNTIILLIFFHIF